MKKALLILGMVGTVAIAATGLGLLVANRKIKDLNFNEEFDEPF